MKFVVLVSVGLLALTASGLALAGQAAETVQVESAYVRAVPPGQPNSAAFMTLRNTDDADHAVVGGHSDAAEVVELHTHIHDEGVMRMRRIERIDVAAGGAQALEPGGLHVMLIGLQGQLEPGETVELTLEFEDGSTVAVQAPVRQIEGMTHHHKDH